jgi:2-C-methyl-D-erythritol 2,4-cyclodiphosphate synthase
MMRIGQGYDVHRLVDQRKLIIGGVDIPHSKGLEAHSDGDVLIHALCDALLGAAGLGDIGKHFPDTDASFKDADSRVLLRAVMEKLQQRGLQLGNADCTIIAQAPKMAPHIEQMRNNLAQDCMVSVDNMNIKATTTEKLGFTGRQEGIAAEAIVLLKD